MTPEEDPSWFECTEHGKRHWCPNTGTHYAMGGDVGRLQPGMRYCVPVFPADHIFAEVSIGDEAVVPEHAWPLALVGREVLSFSDDEALIDLGLWTPYEGRRSISILLMDMCLSLSNLECKSSRHGFSQERALQTFSQSAITWSLLWAGMCPACHSGIRPSGNVSADDVGLDDGAFAAGRPSGGHGPWAGRQGRQEAAASQLKARYGK